MNKYFMKVICFLILLFVASQSQAGSNYIFGYRLDYATKDIKASQIDSAFPDFNQGHTSAFFLRRTFGSNFYFEVGPGAWNSEKDAAQLTYQYNSIGLGAMSGGSIFFDLGLHLGAGLLSLSSGNQKIGEIQTAATVFRNEVGLYMANAGIGYKFGDWSLVAEVRHIGFFEKIVKNLDVTTAGVVIMTSL